MIHPSKLGRVALAAALAAALAPAVVGGADAMMDGAAGDGTIVGAGLGG